MQDSHDNEFFEIAKKTIDKIKQLWYTTSVR
jgi:hypothetical protein